ncbi:transcriptional regulator MalT [Cedecea neteri]|uniref:Helix-turn-helix transcriptional regulator n=1 Tax=Cedecea neteri TaxID=158822 RepID=A0A291E332_9ENTR|nr:helix-turn-helix transcriptional regulator [Cedecea neteri]ATF94480.1 helix-turn-helix transcriptional regulator [Cedecea neteri]SQA97898.1 transcriptional regulator MalT [Cedecea neteri]
MNSYADSPLQSLIRFWEISNEPWGAKDRRSRFIYANRKYHKLLSLPQGYQVEGRYDGELPASTAIFQNEFQAHDRKVEKLMDRVTSIEIHPFENSPYLQPWYFDKYPLINNSGVCIGTIFHGRPVGIITLSKLDKIKVPSSLVFTPPSEFFLKREWEIVFYLLQGFTAKDISKHLAISPRTVTNHISNIYHKAGVSSRRALMEFCHENNISNYIPESFFKQAESLSFQ